LLLVLLFLSRGLSEANRENADLRLRLEAERKTSAALENDYQALVSALETERQAAEQTAETADKLTREIENASDQDRPAGPLLRRAVDSLRDAAASGDQAAATATRPSSGLSRGS
jgi:chromosome segregation ATPase